MYDIRNESLGETSVNGLVSATGPVPVQTSHRYIGNVRSLQRRLRDISYYNREIPLVVADGVFGETTEQAVLRFQEIYGLERTGIVDNNTWNSIVAVSEEANKKNTPTQGVLIFNEGNVPINPGDKSLQLYVIQAMMKALSEIAENISSPEITGIHDKASVDAVKSLQQIAGIDDNGIIDAEFSTQLGQLYEVYVTAERVNNRE